MFAKKQTSVVNSEYYELFTVETVKDVEGNDVSVPRSMGQYSLAQLENEKNGYLNLIASIDEKMLAISALE